MKKIYLDITGMKCLGCMNTVKMNLEKIEGVDEINMELVPGQAEITTEENVNIKDLADIVNRETQYHASFNREEEIIEIEQW